MLIGTSLTEQQGPGAVAKLIDDVRRAADDGLASAWMPQLSGLDVLTVLTVPELEVTADASQIPVGIDGEAVSMTTPVECAIRPGALRVWVPRNRPGPVPPKPAVDWARLRHLAAFRPHRRPGASRGPDPG